MLFGVRNKSAIFFFLKKKNSTFFNKNDKDPLSYFFESTVGKP